jgi:hypothetical protein
MRLPLGRFGEPAVYVGTVREAAGVPFRAVRVMGLAERHLPAVPREDPVIPDAVRARLLAAGAGGAVIGPANAGDRTIEALHALDGVIRNAGARVALSFSRLDADRSMREPASVILEAAAALGRPNAVTREPGPVIPDGAALARDAFRSSPAVRSRVPASTVPLSLLPPLVPARRSRPAASSGPDVPLDGRFDRVVSSRGTEHGGAGVAARGCPRCPGGGECLRIGFMSPTICARMRLARSAIERKHGSSLVITALLV